MSGLLGVGEDGCECVEGGILQDLFCVFGQGLLDEEDVSLHHLLGWAALGEHGQRRDGRLLVGGLQMDEGLVGCGRLLVVMAELVPARGGDDSEDRCVKEHRQQSAVPGGRLVDHGPYSAAQGAGVLVLGLDTGAGGALERLRSLMKIRLDTSGCEERQGV